MSINLSNDILTLNKNKQTCPNRQNMHTLFYEQVVCKRDTKMEKEGCNGYGDGSRNRSMRVRTPVALLRSLSGKYPWERYETPYPPSYGLYSTTTVWRCPRGVMVTAMDRGIVVSEVVLQWGYYVHFWANTLGKGMNHLILPAMG